MLASTVTTSPVASLTSDATTYAQSFDTALLKLSSMFLPASRLNGSEKNTFAACCGSVPSGGGADGVGTAPGITIDVFEYFSVSGASAANTMPATMSARNANVSGLATPCVGSG